MQKLNDFLGVYFFSKQNEFQFCNLLQFWSWMIIGFIKIEYGKGESIIGCISFDLEEKIENGDLPKFIKLDKVSYYSNLTSKYELFEEWDSKWENIAFINSNSIHAIRKVKSNLLGNSSSGEFNALKQTDPLTIILSTKLVQKNKTVSEQIFSAIKEISLQLPISYYLNGSKIISQDLLQENEFVIASMGAIVTKQVSTLNLVEDIKQELIRFNKKFQPNNEDE